MDTNEITADLALGGSPTEQAFVRILVSTPIQMLQKTTATKIESLVHQNFRIPYLFDAVFRKLTHYLYSIFDFIFRVLFEKIPPVGIQSTDW